jgi:UDP-N-acetylglucosamine transferase subunit ALG13
MTVLASGKQPIVVLRLRHHAEAVDNHQLLLSRRLADSGLLTLVEDTNDLADYLERGAEPATSMKPHPSALADDLRLYLGSLLDQPKVRTKVRE